MISDMSTLNKVGEIDKTCDRPFRRHLYIVSFPFKFPVW